MSIKFARTDTPIGPILIFVWGDALCGLAFEDHSDGLRKALNRRFGGQVVEEERDPAEVVSHLNAYFGGDLHALDAIRTDPGGTPFQQQVWMALRKVPAGKTVSYLRLAQELSCPSAIRAVGMANARNPVAVVIPCHRVIGSDGTLTGYGGGIDRKRWLLRHEGVLL